jgi:hypothetical protein
MAFAVGKITTYNCPTSENSLWFALDFSHFAHLFIFISLPMLLEPIKRILNAAGGQGYACIGRAVIQIDCVIIWASV